MVIGSMVVPYPKTSRMALTTSPESSHSSYQHYAIMSPASRSQILHNHGDLEAFRISKAATEFERLNVNRVKEREKGLRKQIYDLPQFFSIRSANESDNDAMPCSAAKSWTQ